jgi:hypothetical protein
MARIAQATAMRRRTPRESTYGSASSTESTVKTTVMAHTSGASTAIPSAGSQIEIERAVMPFWTWFRSV